MRAWPLIDSQARCTPRLFSGNVAVHHRALSCCSGNNVRSGRQAVMEVHQRPQQTPLELNAAGACPPSTSEVRCNQLAVGPGTVYRQTVGGRLSLNECRVAGPVRVHKWDDEAQREAAVQDLQAFCSASIHSLGLESFQPMLLKGAVSDWAAADRWSLDWLVDNFGGERVEVRAAPSLNFAYVEPRLMRLYLKFKRPEQAPSMVAGMSLQDFAMRAQKGCTDPPLFYQSGEYYYMQTHVTKEMRSRGDVDFKQPPFSVVLAPDANGKKKIVPAARARLWVSPQGAVSPLHYDCHDSFLIQLRGTKRMLLWPAEQLPHIYPYRNWHILRRRGKVNPVKPNLKKYPKFAKSEAVEVVLNPGDVLFFPGYWAHYTESCTFSVSMTCRFGLAEEVYKRRPWWSLFI